VINFNRKDETFTNVLQPNLRTSAAFASLRERLRDLVELFSKARTARPQRLCGAISVLILTSETGEMLRPPDA
jgi:hypothetical protein